MPLFIALWSLPALPPSASTSDAQAGRWYLQQLRRWIRPRSRGFRGAHLGLVSGLTFFLLNLEWLLELHHVIDSLILAAIGLLSLALYLALYVAAWGAFAATVGRPSRDDLSNPPMLSLSADKDSVDDHGRPSFIRLGNRFEGLFRTSFNSLRFALLNAAAWTGLEWLRGWMLTGFGWNGLGVALHQNPTLIQIVDIIGVTGLSFLPVFIAGILLHTAWRIHLEAGSGRLRPHLDFMVGVIVLISVFFYGVEKAGAPLAKNPVEVRTLLVQPNIPQSLKWDPAAATNIYQTFNDLTRLNVEINPFDLVVWPEASLPLYLDHPDHEAYLEDLLALGDHSILLGVNVFEPRRGLTSEQEIRASYNSAALLRKELEDAQVHHKSHLVPFGEFLPLRSLFPPIERVFGGLLPSDFDRGRSTEPLVLELLGEPARPNILLSPLICFEDTVPRVVRKLIRRGPQVLVNLTNDGWFGESPASLQHMINASFRCIEFRRPMIRCANTGVTCLIDSTGSSYDRESGDGYRRMIEDPETGNTFIRGTLPVTLKIDLNPPMTFYARFGDAFSMLCAMIAVIGIGFSLGQLRRKDRARS